MLVPYCWLSCWSGCNFRRKSLSPGSSPLRIAIPNVPPKKGISLGVWRTAADAQASLAIHCRPVTFCSTTYFIGAEHYFQTVGTCIDEQRKVDLRLKMKSNLFHELNHVYLMCKHDDHSSCGLFHTFHNPLERYWIVTPRQNLQISQTPSTRLNQVRLKGLGNVETVIIIADQQTDPGPSKVF